jgi:acetyl esterase/lipase
VLNIGLAFTVGFLSAALLGWSFLTVVRTPHYWLWKPGVAATEWGHWLSVFSLGLGVAALARGLTLFAVMAATAAVLFALPVLKAIRLARLTGVHLRVSSLLHRPLPRDPPLRETYRSVDGVSLTLDFYAPAGEGAPKGTLVLVVHGGSWNSGDSTQLSGMNRFLAWHGYPVAALNYRLAPRHCFPAPVEDIAAAIGYLERRPGRAWDRIVLLGRSSGAHLALLAAYRNPHQAIRGVIALYAPTDLVWSWHRPAPARLMDSNRILREFLGGPLEEKPDVFRGASPIEWIRKDVPPTLLVHGANDALVSPLQSRRLAAELDDAGARWRLLEIPWGKHGMDANLAGPSAQLILDAIGRFLVETGREGDGEEASTLRT